MRDMTKQPLREVQSPRRQHTTNESRANGGFVSVGVQCEALHRHSRNQFFILI